MLMMTMIVVIMMVMMIENDYCYYCYYPFWDYDFLLPDVGKQLIPTSLIWRNFKDLLFSLSKSVVFYIIIRFRKIIHSFVNKLP